MFEYDSIEEIAKSYDYLSKADLFTSRVIKRQAWRLQKYFLLSAYGIALSKTSPKEKYTMYKSPKILYSRKNNNLESVREKIAKKLHVSKKEAVEYIEIIRTLMDKTDIEKKFGFDEKEIEELETAK